MYKNGYKFGQISMNDLQKGTEAIVEACCASDIASSQGIGCDNITACIVELRT